jgi:leucyl aminopeptidase
VAVLGTVEGAAAVLEREKAKGEAGELVAVPGADRVFLVGTGDASPAALRKAGAALARRAKSQPDLTLDLRKLALKDEGLRALAEGLLLASYSFAVKQVEPRPLRAITVVVRAPEKLQPALDRAVAVASAVAAARDLVNTPPLEKSPAWLAKQAVGLLKGLEVRVRDDKELAAEGWGGVLAVGMGSSRPPRVVEATYRGGGRRHVVLVGKGITFDTGGISIKPNASMTTMKMDMGGAAAVFATLRAVADLKLPVTVTGVACLAENMPSGSAQRPSDVIRQYGGTTVEVLNTDAEGRLVLADGLGYADRELAPDVVVDIATLTGAMPVALGNRIAGLFASDDKLAGQLEAAAQASGERLWRLPLVDDYRQALDSTTADLRNIGDPRLKLQGGSITAALFLEQFTGGRPWAHLDIAGPAWAGGDDDELTKGGTGYGVRLLVRWLETLAR